MQKENILAVIGVALFSVVLIWWTYTSDKKRNKELEKKNESIDSYTKSFSWRVYIVAGAGLICVIWELGRRFIDIFQ